MNGLNLIPAVWLACGFSRLRRVALRPCALAVWAACVALLAPSSVHAQSVGLIFKQNGAVVESLTGVEGTTIMYSVEMATAPSGDGAAGDDPEVYYDVSASGYDLTFEEDIVFGDTSWDDPMLVTVTIGQDEDSINNTVDIVHTLTAQLGAPEYNNLGPVTIPLNILDDEAFVTISVSDATGYEDGPDLEFTITLSQTMTEDVMFRARADNVTTQDRSGRRVADYWDLRSSGVFEFEGSSARLTIPAGTRSTVVRVNQWLEEADEELYEQFEVFLVDIAPATVTFDSEHPGIGTIIDDDDPPVFRIEGRTRVHEGEGDVVFTVIPNASSSQDTTIAYEVVAGTATAGTDYTAPLGGTIHYEAYTANVVVTYTDGSAAPEQDPGEETLPEILITVPILTDTDTGEDPETFSIRLRELPDPSNPGAFGQPGNATAHPTLGTHTVTIHETTTAMPTVSASVVSIYANGVEEEERGSGDADDARRRLIRYELSGVPSTEVTFRYDAVRADTLEGGRTRGVMDAVITRDNCPVTDQCETPDFNLEIREAGHSDRSQNLTTIAANSTNLVGYYRVPIWGDLAEETDEFFYFRLRDVTGATFADDGVAHNTDATTFNVRVRILDDDDPPEMTILGSPEVRVAETDAAGEVVFTVRASATSTRDTTVTYRTTDSTATAGTDYTDTNGTISMRGYYGNASGAPVTSLTKGQSNSTYPEFAITVTIAGDDVAGDPERTFTFEIAAVGGTDANGLGNATVGGLTSVNVIIEDDDVTGSKVSFVGNPDPVPEGSAENPGQIVFTAQIDTAPTGSDTVEVEYATVAGTAGSAASGWMRDYMETSGTLTFTNSTTMVPITVPLVGDEGHEDTETFLVRLSNAPAGAVIVDAEATGTIRDDDGVPILSLSGPQSVVEGADSAQTYTVTLSNPTSKQVRVAYQTSSGPAPAAVAGTDYATATGTLTIITNAPDADLDATTFPVTVGGGDNVPDGSKNFGIGLVQVDDGNAYVGTRDNYVSITITDDELPTVNFTGNKEANRTAAMIVFDVTISGTLGAQATVEYATSNATPVSAQAGYEYTAASGTLTFATTETSKAITVSVSTVVPKALVQTFEITLSSPSSNIVLGTAATATGTITSDQYAGLVFTQGATTVTSLTGTEGDTIVYSVTLSSELVNEFAEVELQLDSNALFTTDDHLYFTHGGEDAWNIPQTIALTLTEDMDRQTNTATITYSIASDDTTNSAPQYERFRNANYKMYADGLRLPITILDNDSIVTFTDTAATPNDLDLAAGLTLTEDGTVSYRVVLGAQPASTVTVTLASSDADKAMVQSPSTPHQLVFATTSGGTNGWDVARTVTLAGVDDDDGDNDTLSVTHTVTGITGESPANLTVTVTDTDTRGLSLTPVAPVVNSTLTVVEQNTGTYTVQLDTRPSGNVEVTATVESAKATKATVAATGITASNTLVLTFEPGGWDTAQTVTVAGVDDTDGTDETVTITHAFGGADTEYAGLDDVELVATIDDNDTPGLTFTPNPVSATEGTNTTTYTVEATTQPSGDVVLALSVDGTGVTLSETSLTLAMASGGTTGWNVPQTVTVTVAEDDDNSVGESLTITHAGTSTDNDYNTSFTLPLNIVDNDSILVFTDTAATPTPLDLTAGLALDEDGTASYRVALAREPTSAVTVTLESSDTGAASVSSPAAPHRLVFAATSGGTNGWDVPQTVTLAGVDDDDGDNETISVTHTVTGITGEDPVDITVTVTDDETRGLSLTPDALEVDEEGTGTYAVQLATRPSGNVEVTVTSGSAGATVAATGITASNTLVLTFLPGGWDTAQTVTVAGTDDEDGDDETVTITHAFGGADSEYAGLDDVELVATIDDNDTPGLTFNPNPASATEGMNTAIYTVQANTQPAGDVVLALSVGGTGVTLSETSLTLAMASGGANGWNVPQTVTITVDEDDNSISERLTITHDGTSTDAAYNTSFTLPLNIVDNDSILGFTNAAGDDISIADPLTVEEGTTVSYGVKLVREPTGAVAVAVTSDDADKATVSPATLNFDATNWEDVQTVVVTGVEDDDGNDDVVTVAHAVSGPGADEETADLSISVTDNDERGLVFEPSMLVVDEGATAEYTVRLGTLPDDAVVVTLTQDHVDLSLIRASLTFAADAWNTLQTVTVTAAHDDDGRDDTGIAIAHAMTSNDAAYEALADAELTASITDDDEPGLTFDPAGGAEVTEGESETYTVVLATEPMAAVTIALTTDIDDKATLDPASLTFAATKNGADGWNVPRTITISGTQDDDGRSERGTITHAATSTDTDYAASFTLPLAVTDDDAPELVSISIAEGTGPGQGRDEYGFGEVIQFAAVFSSPVVVRGDPQLRLTIGVRSRLADYQPPAEEVGAAGSATIIFAYTVQADDVVTEGSPGISIPRNPLVMSREDNDIIVDAQNPTGIVEEDIPADSFEVDESVTQEIKIDGNMDFDLAAEAGDDQTVAEGEVVTLTGVGTTSGDEADLEYEWTQRVVGVAAGERCEGANAGKRCEERALTLQEVEGTDGRVVTFTAPDDLTFFTTLTFVLEVTNPETEQSKDDEVDINIDAVNDPPEAMAGPDQTVTEGQRVTLDGSESYDPEGSVLTYAWAQESGPDVELTGANQARATFTTPMRLPQDAKLVFVLTVTDIGAKSGSDKVTITVESRNLSMILGHALSRFGRSVGASAVDAVSDRLGSSLGRPPGSTVNLGGTRLSLEQMAAWRNRFAAPFATAPNGAYIENGAPPPNSAAYAYIAPPPNGAYGAYIEHGSTPPNGTASPMGTPAHGAGLHGAGLHGAGLHDGLPAATGMHAADTGTGINAAGTGMNSASPHGAGVNTYPVGRTGSSVHIGRHTGRRAAPILFHTHFSERMHGAGRSGLPLPFRFDRNRLDQSSFNINLGRDEALNAQGGARSDGGMVLPGWSLWGNVDYRAFQAAPNSTLELEGRTNITYLGADHTSTEGGSILGLAFSISDGQVGFVDDTLTGEVRMDLFSMFPYARFTLRDGLEVWGMVGTGTGESTIDAYDDEEQDDRDRGDPNAPPTVTSDTDIDMKMVALGVRNSLLRWGTTGEWSTKADVFYLNIRSDETDLLYATSADIQRMRFGFEGHDSWFLSHCVRLMPTFGMNARFDGGDAETGFGLEMDFALAYEHTLAGVFLEGRVRHLAGHSDGAIEEWGANLLLRFDPGGAGGFGLSLQPAWGQLASRAEAMWQGDQLFQGGLGGHGYGTGYGVGTDNLNAHGANPNVSRLGGRPDRVNAELVYGIHLTDWSLTPYGNFSLHGQSRQERLGLRIEALDMQPGLFNVEIFGERHTTLHTREPFTPGIEGTLHFFFH